MFYPCCFSSRCAAAIQIDTIRSDAIGSIEVCNTRCLKLGATSSDKFNPVMAKNLFVIDLDDPAFSIFLSRPNVEADRVVVPIRAPSKLNVPGRHLPAIGTTLTQPQPIDMRARGAQNWEGKPVVLGRADRAATARCLSRLDATARRRIGLDSTTARCCAIGSDSKAIRSPSFSKLVRSSRSSSVM